MDLFKWVGRKKREEEWMRQPRRLPDFAERLPEDSDRWLVTQEFVNDEDKNLRSYMAIYQPDPKVEEWKLYYVDYDLKREGEVRANWMYELNDPLEIVQQLRAYERKYKNNADYIAHPDQRATYRSFANKYGIHFDDDGNVFRVKTETPLLKGTFMNREALDSLFHKEASKALPLDSWEGIYKGIVDVISPEWTMTEKAFGLAEQMQSVKAVPADKQFDSSPVNIIPVATHVSEVASLQGGVIFWKGAATVPTPKEIQDAREQAAKDAQKPAIEAAATDKPAAAAPIAEGAAEKPVEPPLPIKVEGKTIYEHAMAKTWGGYKEMQQITWQRPVETADLPNSKNYGEYAYGMEALMDKLNKLPAALNDKKTDKYAKEALVLGLFRAVPTVPFRSGRRGLGKHLGDATILVGLLRAGAAVYKEQFGPGKKFTPDGIQLLSTIGKLCTQFAVDRLNVDPEAATKIADVIAKGEDPFGPKLPLEKIFDKHPAPAFTPAPPPSSYIASGGGTGQHKSKKKPLSQRGYGYWD